MPHARFEVAFSVQEDPQGVEIDGRRLSVGRRGVDRVEFLFSANPGEEPRPLAKIASGGEMSRVALAIKATLAEVDPAATLIFDEVDAGIGGETAERVADALVELARTHQVLVVTHLAQIAAAGRPSPGRQSRTRKATGPRSRCGSLRARSGCGRSRACWTAVRPPPALTTPKRCLPWPSKPKQPANKVTAPKQAPGMLRPREWCGVSMRACYRRWLWAVSLVFSLFAAAQPVGVLFPFPTSSGCFPDKQWLSTRGLFSPWSRSRRLERLTESSRGAFEPNTKSS